MEQSLNDKQFLQEQQQILNHIHIIFQLIQENYEREIEEKIKEDERFYSAILTVLEKWGVIQIEEGGEK